MIRSRSWSSLILLLLLAATAVQTDARIRRTDPPGNIPPVLFTTLPNIDPSYPTFVAASAAVSREGEVNQDLFHPLVLKGLRGMLAREPVAGCIELGPFYWELINFPDRSTLPRAASSSHLTVLGRVVDREFGFHFDEAGQLLEIEVEEVMAGDAPLDRYYYFHPVGEFSAGPHRICKSDDRFPAPPALGDRVVLMVPRPVHDRREPFLDIVTPEGVVVLPAEGEIRYPSRFAPQTGKAAVRRSVGELLRIVREHSTASEVRP